MSFEPGGIFKIFDYSIFVPICSIKGRSLLACKKGQAAGAAWNPCISLSFFDFYIIARFLGTPGVLFQSRASILDFRCFQSPFFVYPYLMAVCS